MIKKSLTVVAASLVFVAAAAVSTSSAQAGWRGDAAMAAGMLTVAAGTASVVAGGYGGYDRPVYRQPRPYGYRLQPVFDGYGDQIGWRRVRVY